MEVTLMVHPFKGKRNGGEFVVHLLWETTGGSTEPRGSCPERANWVWETNVAGQPMNWHCFSITCNGRWRNRPWQEAFR